VVSHLYVAASKETPLAVKPYGRLPRYSSEVTPALRAAERTGLFHDGGAIISCTGDAAWRLSAERAGIEVQDDFLPRLLARAALRLRNLDVAEEGI
jgi:hypothetical protein